MVPATTLLIHASAEFVFILIYLSRQVVLWTGVRRACATEGQILKRALTTDK